MNQKSDIQEYLKGKVSRLPSEPGVYQFFDSSGEIIYVGKAKNLRKRVSSYFLSSAGNSKKVEIMVAKIRDIKHIVVNSEGDALLLENNMIKEHQPRYNILLKDDKTFPWIKVCNEPFPRIISTRKMDRDGSKYYGPYPSVVMQHAVLDLVRKIYHIRTCGLKLTEANIKNGRLRPCLEYHIGNCLSPCADKQTPEEYAENVSMAENILEGNLAPSIEYIEKQMKRAVKELRFEEAEDLKNKLEMIENYRSKSIIVSAAIDDLSLFSIIIDGDTGYCNYMRVKRGSLVQAYTTQLRLGIEQDKQEILSQAILSITNHLGGDIAKEILVPYLPSAGILSEHIFHIPKRGEKLKLLELSLKNCNIYRMERMKQIQQSDPDRYSKQIVEHIQRDLHLPETPYHIECFDNSNLGGTNPVASCVVFRNGKPAKKEYRHFNIKTVTGANDFASMREIVLRRYKRLLEENQELPQLIVIDGGKGQLNVAVEALSELGLYGKISIIGLAKKLEEIYFPGNSEPTYLNKNSYTLKVLVHIRDEAHRFGITFHRNKRSANFIKNELESIQGLGKVSIERLLAHFKTVGNIKRATTEELENKVGKSKAELIKKYFESRM